MAKTQAARKRAPKKTAASKARLPKSAPKKAARESKQSPSAKHLQEASLQAALQNLRNGADPQARKPFTFPGISHPKKRAFLAAFGECGNVRRAAEASDIDRKTHQNWMKADDLYREAFEQAQDHASDLLEQEAWRRAYVGVDEPVFQMGMLVGMKRVYSDTLLIFQLKGLKPAKYRERHELVGKDGAELFVAADQRLAGFLVEVAAARDAAALPRET